MKSILLFIFLIFNLSILSGQNFKKLMPFTDIAFGDAGYRAAATFDDKCVFLLGTTSSPHQLYFSNGTPEGTIKIDEMTSFDKYESFINNDPNYLYYVRNISGANDELIQMDKKTAVIEKIYSGSSIKYLTYFNGKLIYANGSLYSFDLSNKTNSILKSDLCYQPYWITLANDRLFILSQNWGEQNTLLTVSDGTPAGTITIKNLDIDKNSSPNFKGPWKVGNKIYFTFYGRSESTGQWSNNMWVSDGTESGTFVLKELSSENNATYTAYGGGIDPDFYFVNADPDSTLLRLYHTNGTIDGTSKFENLNATYINSFFTYKNKLYTFNGQNGNLYTLHGKNIDLVINKLNTKVSIGSPMIFNDSLFFIGTDNSDINDFWKSDGTEISLSKIPQGNPSDVSIGYTAASKKYIYFVKLINDAQKELWIYDPGFYLTNKKINTEVFIAFPNPTSKSIYIPEIYIGSEASILNSAGDRIKSMKLTNTNIELNDLPVGIYYLKIVKDNNIHLSKIIKI